LTTVQIGPKVLPSGAPGRREGSPWERGRAALELADLVYLLVRGRILFAGEPAELEGTDLFAHYLGAESAGQGAGH
jgi:hypothetical protein